MSDHHRKTHRLGVREDARHTVRAPRFVQVGGGSNFKHIDNAVRAAKWNEALLLNTELAELANIITEPNWGTTLTDTAKLELYVRLIERQDLMMQTALNIIYKAFQIDPAAEDLDDIILKNLSIINAKDKDAEMKEYFKDVYRVVTLTEPDVTFGIRDTKTYVIKLARLFKDPLSNILLWPARIKNLFIFGCAEILLSLKADPSLLEKSKKDGATRILFADLQNTFIIQEAYTYTSKGLRDGCNMWQTLGDSVMPSDECALPSSTSKISCIGDMKAMIWSNFCEGYTESENMFDSSAKDLTKYMYSRILADIFKLYKEERATAESVRATLIGKFAGKSNDKTVSLPGSLYRPTIAEAVKSPIGALMRILTPEQYHFIFHILYIMQQAEKESKEEANVQAQPSLPEMQELTAP